MWRKTMTEQKIYQQQEYRRITHYKFIKSIKISRLQPRTDKEKCLINYFDKKHYKNPIKFV